MDKTRVRVNIDGMEFNIVGNDDAKYIEDIAAYIDESIKLIMRRNSRLSRTEAVVLTAINLKDDLEKERKENQRLKELNREHFTSEKLMSREEAIEKMKKLEAELAETQVILDKYVKAEEYSSNRLKNETTKVKSAYSKLNSLRHDIEDKENYIVTLSKKLSNQEKINQDNHLELIELRRELKKLREEKAKLD